MQKKSCSLQERRGRKLMGGGGGRGEVIFSIPSFFPLSQQLFCPPILASWPWEEEAVNGDRAWVISRLCFSP